MPADTDDTFVHVTRLPSGISGQGGGVVCALALAGLRADAEHRHGLCVLAFTCRRSAAAIIVRRSPRSAMMVFGTARCNHVGKKKRDVDPQVEGYFCAAVPRSYRSQWNRYSPHLVIFVILLWSLHTFFYLLLFNA
ncbi:hypothetical protein BDA96_01G438400 [Sorghum bicolor]|jgi:hypothetical protein|uniref:Uncharacterized protein n=2 Tax=Sorghum bicolor TaxID=4558 RepID=A0A921S5G4_SORBI|nr:hypothetical protein BDA96_01G438400 [Sorghum bicolor]KXG39638.1 hypothetical protein SORBI_3001G412300 [Sorghum bicolor]